MYQGNYNEAVLSKCPERLKMKINLTQKFARTVTGHGKTMAYFHCFKIMKQAT
jgi:hypothetical protein